MPGDLVPTADATHTGVIKQPPHHGQVLFLPGGELNLYAEPGSGQRLYAGVACQPAYFTGVNPCLDQPIEPLFPLFFAVPPMATVGGKMGHALVAPLKLRFADIVQPTDGYRWLRRYLVPVFEKTASEMPGQQMVDGVEARIGLDSDQCDICPNGFNNIAVKTQRLLGKIEFGHRSRTTDIDICLF